MSNIIVFPGTIKKEADSIKPLRFKGVRKLLRGMFRFLQAFIILGWPIIRWFVYLDLLLVFLKMVVHSSAHAGLVFWVHCAVVLVGALFVAFYKVKPN